MDMPFGKWKNTASHQHQEIAKITWMMPNNIAAESSSELFVARVV